MILRGLTLWRPWAAAIVLGPKCVENRPWPPSTRLLDAGLWIAIHAGRKFDPDGAAMVARFWQQAHNALAAPDGSLDGRVVDPKEWPPAYVAEGIVGVARVVGAHRFDEDDRSDPWRFGPWCWTLDDVRALPFPVACRGAQGLWRLSPMNERVVRAEGRLP